jgi:hypothetical protein
VVRMNIFTTVINSVMIKANEEKSAASFCHQVAALVPDMFSNFYLVKNKKYR